MQFAHAPILSRVVEYARSFQSKSKRTIFKRKTIIRPMWSTHKIPRFNQKHEYLHNCHKLSDSNSTDAHKRWYIYILNTEFFFILFYQPHFRHGYYSCWRDKFEIISSTRSNNISRSWFCFDFRCVRFFFFNALNIKKWLPALRWLWNESLSSLSLSTEQFRFFRLHTNEPFQDQHQNLIIKIK